MNTNTVMEFVNYEEGRWIGIGMLEGRAVVIIFTERHDDTIRMKALTHERKKYDSLTDKSIDRTELPPLDDSFFTRAKWRIPLSNRRGFCVWSLRRIFY